MYLRVETFSDNNEVFEMEEDRIIYHYCSNTVLESILKNKQLWMSDIANSNDYNEIRILIPKLFYMIEDLYRNQAFSFKYKEHNGIEGIVDILTDVSQFINNTYDSGSLTSFVSCFCEKGDVLSQWRGYANDGKGCSVGFSLKDLKEYCENTNGTIRIDKVEYVDEKQLNSIISNAAQKCINELMNLKNKSENFLTNKQSNLRGELTDIIMMFLFKDYLERIVLDSLKYKWNAFQEEHEWRIYFGSISKNEKVLFGGGSKTEELLREFNGASHLLAGKMKFNVHDDVIVPYYPIELKEVSDSPIKTVIIGPKNRSKTLDVRLMLASYGLNSVDVKYSKIAYR